MEVVSMTRETASGLATYRKADEATIVSVDSRL